MEHDFNQKITVDYDPISERFIIKCPFWANDSLNGLHGKRFLRAKQGWGVTMTRRNVEYIAAQLRDTGLAAFSERAHEVLDESIVKLTNMGKGQGGFPAWYPFKTKPRAHQVKCMDKWYGQPAFACFMDRGTGKTKTTIDIASALRMEDKIDCMIVACKLSGRRNWEEEWAMHSPIGASFHFPDTSKKKEFKRWMTEPHDMKVMVIGLESLSAGSMAGMMREFAMAHTKVMMAIDESHMIANPKARRALECVTMRNLTAYRTTLTGTPISTGPMNLYMQFEFLDPDIIGTGDYYSFRNRYAVMGGYRNAQGRPMQIVGYQNIEELTATVAPFVFECRKSEVLDLPPKVFKKSYVELTKEQRTLYDKIKKEQTYEWAGKEVTCENVLGVALRLHQVAGGYITTYTEEEGPNGKIKRVPTVHEIVPWDKNPKVLDMLDYAADEKPMIIWCAYRAEIAACVAALKEKFPHLVTREIHGGVSEADRNRAKDEFQSGKCTYLVGNTATGGASLTLTACEIMYYFNNTEKMVDREQSEDRAHRDGLTHSVLYIDSIAERTVDVTIMKSLGLKVNLSDYIRDHIANASRLLAGEE